MTNGNRLIIRFTADDNMEIWTDSADITVLSVDERTERDRVFQLGNTVIRTTPAHISKLIGEYRIGVLGDMPGVEAQIERLLAGEPEPAPGSHLSVVTVRDGDRT